MVNGGRLQGGLTRREAEITLARSGANVIETKQDRTVLRIIGETLREPTFVLLLVAAGLYLALGSLGEGLFITAGAVVSLGMVILQEARSERALQALQALAEPEARVVRDGRECRIAARDLVPGDLMLVNAGERVAADGAIVSDGLMTIDESLMSGESVPVAKAGRTGAGTTEEDAGLAFAGTLIVSGEGAVRVTATGMATRLGGIGASLQAIQPEQTPLQQSMTRLVARLGLFSAATCLAVVLA